MINLKNNLHYYFIHKVKLLSLITLNNVIYLSLFTSIKLLQKFHLFMPFFTSNNPEVDTGKWAYSFTILVVQNIAFYSLIFLNDNVINFKKFL